MGKLPAFLFYPGDWIQDTRPLSLAAKGVWIDLLCAMWRAPERGVLTLPLASLARIICATEEDTSAIVDELLSLGICDADPETLNGITEPHTKIREPNAKITEPNAKITLINRRMRREDRFKKSGKIRQERYQQRKNNGDITPPSLGSVSISSSISSSEKETLSSDFFDADSNPMRMAELLFDLILKRHPGYKRPNLKNWAKQVDLMLRADGRDPLELESVIRKSQSDPFWQSNILNMTQLRQKYDQLYLKFYGPKATPEVPWRISELAPQEAETTPVLAPHSEERCSAHDEK